MEDQPLQVRVLRGGRVREIRLARPPVNVLDLGLLEDLDRAIAATTEAIVVLRGDGKLFSAGVDVADHVPERVEAMIRGFHRVLGRIEGGPAVSVAAVHGAALGGGLELALACDLTVATADCRLALPEIGLGVFPPWAAARFPRRFPGSVVADLLLTGEELSGERAHTLGLVNRLAPAAGLEGGLEGFLDLLLRHSDAALRHARQALALGRGAGGGASDPLAAVERLYLEDLMATEDASEGLRAFMERRAPVWRHR
jgi:cyclohexa-1,5-dienecarbonyl-CoA hydratase